MAGALKSQPKKFEANEENIKSIGTDSSLKTKAQYTCYTDSKTKAFPINRFKTYVKETVV
jgi:hypothetical protein